MNEVILAILAAIVYAVGGYFKSSGMENFQLEKFLATVLVGALVGGTIYATGSPLTEESVRTQFLAYAGIVVLVETGLKGLLRRIRNG